ncbi:2-keto-4-pentenoate hydratase/2-oxohepta-3-ene-1,7-dioic acid hydratase in catechol pathway [Halanaerobium saccharolyticum]|uniref:2-keto-4-pentenoate hydratase/2-oxohepta-3-ene-1,7-dioic acid hydratase in catechol pathway n=1 Tax=Halanaerobium saccharolyticum TaxID=43595 RepID=A0A4R7YSV4_9FIRM|nr:fumarylacetoacetate hydrolase family protein [Halanaerobium saccharolyticum]RAK05190.1 2-keto-4-pentenoate hydratase/2-oxohepta-3-ene-1,7-dioic acid hydratase in catechol pathway [Halanaerobium saccharolyticum]TDV99021.1 2-keto-4-pentenoate hydratase/2-oxohepta-3-ene-1,7-dioic acid hydratase in catechol pathway [Halanaerobium saccharolyticum]TDX51712.1 2-keto-4-pentenoate hydratase/2-oxohepta-3-ene-1,7-dioic acid hydratase in catechol pathway [Halanaerobium saccharolyticum]
MRIIRYQKENEIKNGILKDEKIFKLEGDIFSDFSRGEETADLKEVELLAPVIPPNIIAIGLNYRQHAVETGAEIPERPVIFLKATSSLADPNSEIILPKLAPDEVDYEAELAVIIGKKAKNIETVEVDEYILGYSCANDVSARDCQKKLDEQWARGKSFDTFCPLGPWIETELDPGDLKIKSILNGEVMQQSKTSDMIFNIDQLISYLSHNMTLLPGTVILTGTPEGVGFAREDKIFLRDGDQITIEIEGIGSLENTVKKGR